MTISMTISVTMPLQLSVVFNTSVRFSVNQPVVVLTSEPDHSTVYTWYSSGSNGTYKEIIECTDVLPSYPFTALNATLVVCVLLNDLLCLFFSLADFCYSYRRFSFSRFVLRVLDY